MLSIIHACALIGLNGKLVEVQVDYNPRTAIPSFNIVGLPDAAVRESRERVRSAIKNSNLQFPMKRYVVNLSPADLPKHGPAYDLPIAVGTLASTDQIPLESLENAMFIGELSLDGRVMPINGAMSMAVEASEMGLDTIYVPAENASEAALIRDIQVIPVETLGALVEHLYSLNPIEALEPIQWDNIRADEIPEGTTDFADVKGQEHIKRALEIAAAGGHNVRMSGPPGVGKSMLARALPGILPRMSMAEALEVTRIYSVAGILNGKQPLRVHRPFRSPHHTISQAGLVGGGSIPRPGEISLGHLGVLFLDEFNELPTKTLEVLRQPIEDKVITISRANSTVTFPANFMLVAAHNPCPCGYYGDSVRACTCTPAMIRRYQSKISGPLMDRIDIHVDVPRVDYDKLTRSSNGEPSQAIRKRVESARLIQQNRFNSHAGIYSNADMNAGMIDQFCISSPQAKELLNLSIRKLQLSARSYHRILKLSRTIADLANCDEIDVPHVAEAIQYRPDEQL